MTGGDVVPLLWGRAAHPTWAMTPTLSLVNSFFMNETPALLTRMCSLGYFLLIWRARGEEGRWKGGGMKGGRA